MVDVMDRNQRCTLIEWLGQSAARRLDDRFGFLRGRIGRCTGAIAQQPGRTESRNRNDAERHLRRHARQMTRAPGAPGVRSFVVEAGANSIHAIIRSEEHTSELQSLMRISYAVFCLKKKNTRKKQKQNNTIERE